MKALEAWWEDLQSARLFFPVYFPSSIGFGYGKISINSEDMEVSATQMYMILLLSFLIPATEMTGFVEMEGFLSLGRAKKYRKNEKEFNWMGVQITRQILKLQPDKWQMEPIWKINWNHPYIIGF